MLVNLFHRRVYMSTVFIAVPLVLSAFMHLWNPVGFPAVHVDEGHYMRRAMQVLEGLGPQESIGDYVFAYDHPYFGQLFLGSVLKLIGYPDLLQPQVGDIHSIEMLYLVPRVLMGVLAVIDTFLVYKIAETRYNRKVAFIAATLFAVMPLSWFTRGIFLDSILLPFLLSSIYFAVSTRQAGPICNEGSNRKKYLILLSGIFLGLAIFTKTPAFIMIPLMAITISKNNKDVKSAMMIWLIPVVIIPLVWPAYVISQAQFTEWIEGVFYQASRETGKHLRYSLDIVAQIDPILLFLAAVGFIYSEIKRDYFTFWWIAPYATFLFLIGWVVPFHWIILLPAFCIVTSVFIEDLSRRLKTIAIVAAVSAITAMGLVSTSIFTMANLNSSYFELYSFTTNEIVHNSKDEPLTTIGSHRTRALTWIPKYVFDSDVIFRDTDIPNDNFTKPIQTEKFILVVDSSLLARLNDANHLLDSIGDRKVAVLYQNGSETIATYIDMENVRYDFLSISENYGLGRIIEIKANY
jgi:hypothetical protein